ncbi:ATP-binding cassette domain-containing protein [Alteromonas sp. C1M14]|nr:ATP-binding cassette domain-containing protein [Alteromonas sp. C1M14]
MTAIVGENGCGKSTLLGALAGTTFQGGQITILNRNIHEWSAKSLAQHRAVMQQQALTPFSFLTDEVLLLGRSLYREPMRQRLGWLQQVASWLSLEPLLGRDIQTLSGGEKQRIFLGKALMQLFNEGSLANAQPDLDNKLLILDEPTSALDFRHQRDVMQRLDSLTRLGLTIICVSHDINLISPYCQQMWILGDGQCLAQGNTRDVLTVPTLSRCFHTQVELLQRENKPPLVTH